VQPQYKLTWHLHRKIAISHSQPTPGVSATQITGPSEAEPYSYLVLDDNLAHTFLPLESLVQFIESSLPLESLTAFISSVMDYS
jgi:hypothetical protein